MRVIGERYRLGDHKRLFSAGETFAAYDLKRYRSVLIWLLPLLRATQNNSLAQQQSLAEQLSSPYILNSISRGNDLATGALFFVYPFITAPSLAEAFIERRGLSQEYVARFFLQLADALIDIHSNNIVHGRIHPKNIILKEEGVLNLIGFGLESVQSINRMDDTLLVYLSPEQISGEKATQASDLYSTGIIMRHCLDELGLLRSGGAGRAEYTDKLADGAQSFRWDSYANLVPVIEQLTAREVSERYQNADDLKIALAEILDY